MKKLDDLLRGWPRLGPPALIYDGREVSAASLHERSARATLVLRRLGIRKGDRVALWLPNCPAWLELFFACARLGAIVVSVNTRFRSSEVQDIVGRSGAKLLILWPGFRQIDFFGILGEVDAGKLGQLEAIITYTEGGQPEVSWPGSQPVRAYADLIAEVAQDDPPPEQVGGEDGCAIFTTSGTTRAPKFVLHTHRSIVDHANDVVRAFGYDDADAVFLLGIPLCGVFGFCQMTAALAAGRPTVLMPAYDPPLAADLIARHRVTHMNATDDMYAALVDAGRTKGLPDSPMFPSLRRCGFAAFNGDPAATIAMGEATGIPFTGLYGMSEVQALFAGQSPDDPPARRAMGGGRPVSPQARVRVRDPETGQLAPQGEPGEIEIQAPSLMAGYFGNEDATRDAMTGDGFLRTGDLGYLTDDGFVFLSRLGDAMRLGGFLVSPAEIAGRIEELPAVDGCQVVAVGVGGRPQPVAFVRLAPGAAIDEEEIIAHCRAGLAKFKVPARIGVVENFPVAESANGVKVQRGELRKMAEALVAGEG